ncbi:LytR/AlgR family response regulator transcription factor [Sphingobacterium thalpophilum]|uniref:Sensory transduction protein lytR n=1 Tax=Sphingobacterium thalpophilum TaxID=259 RepID=A0A4U9VJB5_9SPHI|nr:LytTR family DNA-binding domain-containing protein [Sphingobacterium thalpophilum]VTR43424.1 Sensory transduction protein lytR [Sphingobacterium thalpophilum]
MKVLIVEDENLAAKKLVKTLLSIAPGAEVLGVLDSVESTVEWLETNKQPDLILMDIELTDGQSFEIFKQTEVTSTVIFTTSYDEHALKAFKVNSIDYLLKPVQKEELEAALQKFERLQKQSAPTANVADFEKLMAGLQQIKPKTYRKRFLVKSMQRLISINVADIAYFYSDDRLNFFKTYDDKRYIIDYTMDELENMVEPDDFFRISRAFLVATASIDKIHDYFGHRLSLHLKPLQDKEAIVSREKVTDFKLWLGK